MEAVLVVACDGLAYSSQCSSLFGGSFSVRWDILCTTS